jgi:hypothetical protein
MDVFQQTSRYARRLHIIPAAFPRKAGTTTTPDTRLYLAVHEYWLPNSGNPEFTLLLTHGTSFNKDLWEIIINDLLERPGLAGRTVRILALDAATHGASAVCNIGHLGTECMWLRNTI